MTEPDNEQVHPPIPYGGDYKPAADVELPQVQWVKALSGYAQLQELTPNADHLALTPIAAHRLEQDLARMSPSDRQGLASQVAAYLGDIVCASHSGALWELTGDENPVVRLSPEVTWDVHKYIEARIADTPGSLSAGLVEADRIILSNS